MVSACLERLLALVKSVLHSAQSGRPSDDRIVWPASADKVARTLRWELILLLAEVEKVARVCDAKTSAPEIDDGCEADDDDQDAKLRSIASQCSELLRSSLPLCAPIVWWACVVSRAERRDSRSQV